MRWLERGRETTIAGGLSVAIIATIAASAGAHTFDQPDRVLVDTAGDDAERVRTIGIGRKRGQRAKVVISHPLDRLGLGAGDRLIANAEVQVTTDCRFELPRCVGKPYGYNPKVKAKLTLAPTPTAFKGPGTTPVAQLPARRCRHVQHHCVTVFQGSAVDISAEAPPACALAGACYANVVLSAFNRKAKRGNRLIIGEDEPDGTIVQDKGRINALRLRPLVPGPEPPGTVTTVSTSERLADKVPIDEFLSFSKVVVFSQRLDGLEADEQISVFARMTTNLSELPRHKQLVNSRLILAGKPHATRPGKLVGRVMEQGGELAEANGFNCMKSQAQCLTKKVGVARLIADARKQKGARVPLYVNLVVGSKGGTHDPGAGVTVTGGRLDVVRYPAGRYG